MIFRISKDKENPYVMVNKTFVNDSSISWKAKGVLLYLLSKPDDWKVYENDIVKHARDGRDSVRSAIKELIKAGYISRTRQRDEMGRLTVSEYVVYEVSSKDGKSNIGKTNIGKSNTTNNNLTNNNITKEDYTIKNGVILHPSSKDAIPSLVNLYDSDDPFIKEYLRVMSKHGLRHKKMTEANYDDVISKVQTLQENFTVKEFSEGVQEHFDNLPKRNDGDIIPFLKASMRYFNERLDL